MFLFVMCSAIIVTVFPVYGQSCDINCISSNCTNSYCRECTDGYFPIFGGECKPCEADNCIKCYSENNCTECEEGFFRRNSIIGTFYCYSCNDKCSKCSSIQSCLECKSGYYGNICSYDCNLCRNGLCDKVYCTHGCKDGYYEIDTGQFGLCLPCTNFDSNCITCSRLDNIASCNQCKTGYFIQSYRCVLCTGIEQCGMCPGGKWGDYCDKDCFNCNDNICNEETGKCTSGCNNGYYKGHNKQCTPCKFNCIKSVCDPNNGTCTEGCNGRYSGLMCSDQCADSCKTCYQNDSNVCSNCYPGYYSTYCNMTCSETCVDSDHDEFACDAYGFCLYGCENGFTGDMCQRKILTDLRTDTSTFTTSAIRMTTRPATFANQPLKDSPPIAAIAGGVTGGIVVIVTIGVVIWIVVKRRHNTKPHTYENENVMKDMRSCTTTATDNGTVERDIEATPSNTDAEYSIIGEATDGAGSGYETLDMHQSVEAQYTSLR